MPKDGGFLFNEKSGFEHSAIRNTSIGITIWAKTFGSKAILISINHSDLRRSLGKLVVSIFSFTVQSATVHTMES